jgi:hypothetical protein
MVMNDTFRGATARYRETAAGQNALSMMRGASEIVPEDALVRENENNPKNGKLFFQKAEHERRAVSS